MAAALLPYAASIGASVAPQLLSAAGKYLPKGAGSVLKYAPQILEAAPAVAQGVSGLFRKGKKIANFLFSSKGRRNLAHMLSSSEGRGKLLDKASSFVGKGLNTSGAALELGNRLGIVNQQQLDRGQNLIGKGHQGFQAALGQLSDFSGSA